MIEQSQGDTLVNPVDTTVTVSRSVSQPVKEIWKLLVTREGAEALLGAGGELGDKGDSWHAATAPSASSAPTTRWSRSASAGTRQRRPRRPSSRWTCPRRTTPRGGDPPRAHPGGWDTEAITEHWESALDRLVEAS